MWEIYSFRKLLLLAAAAAFSGVNLIMESPDWGNEMILLYLCLYELNLSETLSANSKMLDLFCYPQQAT